MRIEDKMLTIRSWQDLTPYGIQYLTGESCSYAMRMLCDVNEKGMRLVCSYLGISGTGLKPAWNRTVDGVDAVGSIMLPFDILPNLAKFAMLQEGCLYIYTKPDSTTVIGTFAPWHQNPGFDDRYHVYGNPNTHPSVDGRNVHQATGRTD